MNSMEVAFLFLIIASANCAISDDIFDIVSNNQKCNQSKSALDSLKIMYCETSGNRGSADLLCNGIKSVIKDVCNENSSVSLAQVKDSSIFNDSLNVFCKKVGILSVHVKLPKNVSDTLNIMQNNKSCSILCALVNTKLNPLCPFLVSYIELKNSPVPKNDTVFKSLPIVKPEISIENNNQTKNVEKAVPAESQPVNESSKLNERPNITKGKTNEIQPPKLEAPSNQPLDTADNPPETFENVDETDIVLSPVDGRLKENPDNIENSEKQSEDLNEDIKSSVDHINEPENGQTKAAEQESVKITSAEREPFAEAESSHFFTYFVFISALCIFFYVAMYNKKKILALVIEGRRSNVKRRPNSAAYSKLDCTLEEAMASGPSTSSSNTLLY